MYYQVILRCSIVYLIFLTFKVVLLCNNYLFNFFQTCTVSNNDTLSFLHKNFLRDWLSFKVCYKNFQYWLNDTTVMSYGLVRTRYSWNFSKILILSGQTIDSYYLYIAHVLLFTLAVSLFRLALPLLVWQWAMVV